MLLAKVINTVSEQKFHVLIIHSSIFSFRCFVHENLTVWFLNSYFLIGHPINSNSGDLRTKKKKIT